jgi:hypothetical protein
MVAKFSQCRQAYYAKALPRTMVAVCHYDGPANGNFKNTITQLPNQFG